MRKASGASVVVGTAVLLLLAAQLGSAWVDLDRRAFRVRLPVERVVRGELAEAYFANEQLEEARRELEWLLEHGGATPRNLASLASIFLVGNRDLERARELFEQALQADPALAAAEFGLGLVAKRRQELGPARLHLERAGELSGGEAFTLLHLGEVCERLDDRPAARILYERILEQGFPAAGAAVPAALQRLRSLFPGDGDAARWQQELAAFAAGPPASPLALQQGTLARVVAPPPVATAGERARPAAVRFREGPVLCSLESPARALELCDADGDRRPDVLVLAGDGASVYVAGSAGEYSRHPVAEGRYRAARCGDVLGTGRSAVLLFGSDAVDLLVPDRALEFTRMALAAAGSWNDAVFADLDGDGDPDLAAATAEGLTLLWNQGSLFLPEPPGEGWPREAVHWVRAEDLDGDGDLDLLVGGPGQEPRLLARSGAGFRRAPEGGIPAEFAALLAAAPHLADLNHDGRVDLLGGAPPKVCFGEENGFSRPQRTESVATAPAARLLDLDRSGDLDLFWAGESGPSVVLGSLLQTTLVETVLRRPALLAVPGDLDLDGDLDLVVATESQVEVWEDPGEEARNVLLVALEGRGGGQAQGALVEVRSGPLYQRRRSTGLPMTFGLGDDPVPDRVKVTWSDGTTSHAVRPEPGGLLVLEQ